MFPIQGQKKTITCHGLIILAVVLFAVWGHPCASAAATFEIREAEWKAHKSELEVKGRGRDGSTVRVENAGSGALLGSVTVDSKDKWKWKVKNPTSVPCRVLASSEASVAEMDVTDAPPDCDGSTPPPVTLTNLSISGPGTVPENASANYSATAGFSDGSTQDVTGGAAWSLDSTVYAGINASGLLTTLEVPANQTVSILAGYSHNGVTKNASVPVIIQDVSEPGTGSHTGRFSIYEGTKTCLTCHTQQALEVHDSVHYQWQGDASETTGLNSPRAGKLGGINDFCIYPDINWIGKLTNVNGAQVDGGCAKCHVGLGAKPAATPAPEQLENIDCLICHSDDYKRRVESVGGVYRFVADTANMTVSLLQAAQNITPPSKDSCLNCHTKAGGGNNYKRGDIEEAHRDPARDFDVHMASRANGGAGLNCLDCHTARQHRIAGRGTDLRPRELNDPVTCTNCHLTRPHNNPDVDKHTARVNCTVCHIPTFAKTAATDMERDWSLPGDLMPSKGLYEPNHVKGTHEIPEYRFFNGRSYFYQFGEPASPGPGGRIVMSAPQGNILDAGAKIHAFKHHLGRQPIDPVTNRLLPLKIGKFFETGNVAVAAQLGVAAVGWIYNGHEFADTERFMGLFHEVTPKIDALSCNNCHGSASRLDFAALGYTPNATYNNKPLCASCHKDQSDKWKPSELFTKVHKKHVTDRNYDCQVCHIFTSAN